MALKTKGSIAKPEWLGLHLHECPLPRVEGVNNCYITHPAALTPAQAGLNLYELQNQEVSLLLS